MRILIAAFLLMFSGALFSASVIDVTVESAGEERTRVTYTVTLEDNDGARSTHKRGPIMAAPDYDAVGNAPTVAAQMLTQLSDAEEASAESMVEDGNSLDRALNPKWATSKKIAKRLIRLMMRERDPRLVIALEPLIQYLRANYNATQIASFLDLSTDQVLRMNRRINAILQDSGTVKAQLLVFDGEHEEIDD